MTFHSNIELRLTKYTNPGRAIGPDLFFLMKVFLVDNNKTYDYSAQFIDSLNIDIDTILWSDVYSEYGSSFNYGRCKQLTIRKIGLWDEGEDHDEAVLESSDTFIIIWNGKDYKVKNLIKKVNTACKDCYIYRTDINKAFKFVQERLNFEF